MVELKEIIKDQSLINDMLKKEGLTNKIVMIDNKPVAVYYNTIPPMFRK